MRAQNKSNKKAKIKRNVKKVWTQTTLSKYEKKYEELLGIYKSVKETDTEEQKQRYV